MSKQQSDSRQLKMVFSDDEGLWELLPEKNRVRCRVLLVRLLSEVVRGEDAKEEESDDEREDTTGAP